MNRNWRYSFRRVLCVLGFLLLAQIAYAEQQCLSVMGFAQRSDVTTVSGEPCVRQPGSRECRGFGFTADVCARQVQRTVDASAHVSYDDPPPSADALRYAATRAVPILQQGIRSGPAPGFAPPVHILFRRYLS